MAQHVWGPDATAMVENHEPQDALLMKYQHNIVDMSQALKGKRVLDIGWLRHRRRGTDQASQHRHRVADEPGEPSTVGETDV